MLCFGEAFLQGFDGLCWDYAVDRSRAVAQSDAIMARLRQAAEQTGVDLAFGYIERDGEALYSSYMVLGGGLLHQLPAHFLRLEGIHPHGRSLPRGRCHRPV